MAVRKRRWRTRNGDVKEAWVVDYTDQDGDRHIETFKRKKDADARAQHIGVDVRAGIHTAAAKSVTVTEAAADWIRKVELDERERSTIAQYRQHARHITARIGNQKLAKLTKPQSRGISGRPLGEHVASLGPQGPEQPQIAAPRRAAARECRPKRRCRCKDRRG